MVRRRSNGDGSIVKRTKTVKGKAYEWWEARYCAGVDVATGKIKRPTITGESRDEVAQKLRAATASVDAGTYTEPSEMPLKKWADIWVSEYANGQKYATLKTYRTQIENHITKDLGSVPLRDLTKREVQIYKGKETENIVQTFINDLTRIKHLAPKTVKNIHGVLSLILEEAVNRRYIPYNPCHKIKLPRIPKSEVRPLTDEEISAFLKVVDSDEFYAPLFKTVLFTGLRLSEAIGLRWSDVNFKAGTIRVAGQLQKRPKKDGGFVFVETKSDSGMRTLKPATAVLEVLKAQSVNQLSAKNKARDQWQGWRDEKERKTAPVFTNEYGLHQHPQTVYNHAKKLFAQIGADDAYVHTLRHSYATVSLQNGDDVKTLQENLGHSDPAFSLRKYGHVSEKMKDASASRMQKYIEHIG